MPGPVEEEGGSFATALRATREALERAERDARQKAAEIVQQAQEQAHRIQAEAEAAAQLRARAILDEAEERARQLPAQLLPGLIGQVDDARILFGEIRHRLQDLLESRGETVAEPAPAGRGQPVVAPIASSGLDSPKPPSATVPDGVPPEEAEEEDEPTLHKPGAHTIVRGLRVQMLEEMMQKQGGGQQGSPAPPAAAPAPAPAPAESQDEPRRRWPFG